MRRYILPVLVFAVVLTVVTALPTPKTQPVVSPVSPTPPAPTVIKRGLVRHSVPFTSQAPNSDWNDPALQDGCEETSIIMAVYWVNNKDLLPSDSLKEIFSLVEYQKEEYGEYRDTSLTDTADRLLKGYYGYSNYSIFPNAGIDLIKEEIYRGNLVILPMNGQLLGNPNYTAPGPERHMLLIIGFDPQTNEFITNDSGTRNGKAYRYSPATVFSAIRDYSTGYHIPITQINKPMLVIRPPQ